MFSFPFIAVVRGVVLNADFKSNVYNIKVLDLFKDEVDLSRAEDTRILSARLNLKVYNSPYNFPLRVGKVYVLAGQLRNGKLQMRRADNIFLFPVDNEWKNVTPTQREGLFFHYKKGCKCQIGKCYGVANCLQKVQGCEYSVLEKRPRFDVCRMKHQFCDVSRDDKGATQCQWKTRETTEFQDCDGKP